jgi:DNA-binding MarR family transcriptional regulator
MSALVRWSESRHIRSEVSRRSRCTIAPSALRLLEHFDIAGPMRVKDIADCLSIDISTASLQLRELKDQGLARRSKDPSDGRVGVISITAKGRSSLQRVRAARRDLLEELFADVSPDRLSDTADLLLLVQQHMLDGMIAAGYVVAK